MGLAGSTWNQWVRGKRKLKILVNQFGLAVTVGQFGLAVAGIEMKPDGAVGGFVSDLLVAV